MLVMLCFALQANAQKKSGSLIVEVFADSSSLYNCAVRYNCHLTGVLYFDENKRPVTYRTSFPSTFVVTAAGSHQIQEILRYGGHAWATVQWKDEFVYGPDEVQTFYTLLAISPPSFQPITADKKQ